MFANNYLNNGKMSFGVDYSDPNTGNTSYRDQNAQREYERDQNITPEPIRTYTDDYIQATTQSKCIS